MRVSLVLCNLDPKPEHRKVNAATIKIFYLNWVHNTITYNTVHIHTYTYIVAVKFGDESLGSLLLQSFRERKLGWWIYLWSMYYNRVGFSLVNHIWLTNLCSKTFWLYTHSLALWWYIILLHYPCIKHTNQDKKWSTLICSIGYNPHTEQI